MQLKITMKGSGVMPEKVECTYKREPMSKIRREYVVRLVARCIIFVLCLLMYIYRPDMLDILKRGNFFRSLSPLHLLWVIWIIDMIYQLVPVKNNIPLGSQKLFRQRFKPIRDKVNYQALREYVINTTQAAYKVMIIWAAFIILLGILHYVGLLKDEHLFLVSVGFYVCDLICVLIWCPFRLILKNRCCTTCRIFNWDHLMMFTPMLFIRGFYSYTLLLLAIAVWLLWELCVMMYPERFWEHSNAALRCSQCTDKLCTQYCQKLRTPPRQKNK